MSGNKEIKPSVKYLTSAISGLVIALVIVFLRGILDTEGTENVLRILCDAFFIPGILMTCFGVLSIITKAGTFDGLQYSFVRMWDTFRNIPSSKSKAKSYYDYVEDKKKKHRIQWHLIYVGLAFIAIAVIILLVYNMM